MPLALFRSSGMFSLNLIESMGDWDDPYGIDGPAASVRSGE